MRRFLAFESNRRVFEMWYVSMLNIWYSHGIHGGVLWGEETREIFSLFFLILKGKWTNDDGLEFGEFNDFKCASIFKRWQYFSILKTT